MSARSTREASVTDVASGPAQLTVPWQGISPVPLTRPVVGFRPTTPQNADGIRIEPPPSLPTDAYDRPEATAEAEPLEEPPQVRSSAHGLTASP